MKEGLRWKGWVAFHFVRGFGRASPWASTDDLPLIVWADTGPASRIHYDEKNMKNYDEHGEVLLFSGEDAMMKYMKSNHPEYLL